jgi:YHS domain-containing protein
MFLEKHMKRIKTLVAVGLLASFAVGQVSVLADDAKSDAKPDAKLKPYTLKTCVVSGEKLDDMGEPFVYKYKDREIKFCCKDCLKDFNKNPDKYIKKIEEAEAKAKK